MFLERQDFLADGEIPGTIFTAVLVASGARVRGEAWPMWGRDATRNLVSPEKNAPTAWNVDTGKNIKWKAQLGSISRGNPVVADGLVWVGTNNQTPRDPRFKKDASVLMCLRESDGQFLYHYVSPRLPGGQFRDRDHSSMSCSPLVQGDRLWFATNRCEAVCVVIGPLRRGQGEPRVVWKVDMIKDFGVNPFVEGMGVAQPGSVGAYKDWIYVTTGNGVDEGYNCLLVKATNGVTARTPRSRS